MPAPDICGYCGAALSEGMPHTAFCVLKPEFAEASHGDASAIAEGGYSPGQQQGEPSWIRRSRVAANPSYSTDAAAGEANGPAIPPRKPAIMPREGTPEWHLWRAESELHYADECRLGWVRDVRLGEAARHLAALVDDTICAPGDLQRALREGN